MSYYVYMLKCTTCKNKKTYVGYTSNLKRRLLHHNSGLGAKFTKGNQWIIIYKRRFLSKTKAMSYEYSLKSDKKKRLHIYNNF